jgi:putative hemolysin
MIPAILCLLAVAAAVLGTVGAAFSALMPLSQRLLAERTARTGRLGRYLDDPVELFGPVRLLLALVQVLAIISLAGFIGIGGPRSAGLVFASAVVFVLLFEHVIPLLVARRNPEAVLVRLLPWVDPFVRAVWAPLGLVARPRVARGDEAGPVAAADDQGEVTDAYLDAGEQQGLIERDERKLLQSVVDFSDTLVHEVMTPRPDICAIRADASLEELRTCFREQGYSRIPAYADSLDNILGFVFVKDLMRLPPHQPAATPLADLRTTQMTSLIRAAHVVPETKKVSELLREFQRGHVQIAIVVDEYGGTAGLVTLEDLVEELVGEIRDEDDEEVDAVVGEPDGAFVMSGRADIEAAAEALGVVIEAGGFETVGGYIMARVGRVPTTGEVLEIDGLVVDILDAERRRVRKVRARRRAVTADERETALASDAEGKELA